RGPAAAAGAQAAAMAAAHDPAAAERVRAAAPPIAVLLSASRDLPLGRHRRRAVREAAWLVELDLLGDPASERAREWGRPALEPVRASEPRASELGLVSELPASARVLA
ncbi:MAG TPA: hypothetical protein VNC50_15365, partial [Planctomycetia bacterium]|nr:hypothetical protein [Planctomycetia bacterium]